MAIASEGNMRSEAKEFISGDNLRTELTPFTFSTKEKHLGVQNGSANGLSRRPIEKIEDMLIFNDSERTGYIFFLIRSSDTCSVHRLTWHEERLPQDEIWVKIGGDKGGGSFKMNFQICNVHNPNSPNNTCVFCVYEAPDSPANLSLALGRYREQINIESRSMS